MSHKGKLCIIQLQHTTKTITIREHDILTHWHTFIFTWGREKGTTVKILLVTSPYNVCDTLNSGRSNKLIVVIIILILNKRICLLEKLIAYKKGYHLRFNHQCHPISFSINTKMGAGGGLSMTYTKLVSSVVLYNFN